MLDTWNSIVEGHPSAIEFRFSSIEYLITARSKSHPIINSYNFEKTIPMNASLRFFLFLFCSLFLFPLIALPQDPVEVEVGRFLDEWHNDASRADMPAYFDKIDEGGIYIGTDATENWTKQAFYDWSKPYFDKGKAWSFQAEERNIYFSEDLKMAWFDEKLSSSSGPLRGSGVLINRNGQWKILHYVLSLPVPNEKFTEVLELIIGG